jgi:(p)ppGpp synthase/HD superfamily hydrolase
MEHLDVFPLVYTRRWRDALELAERAHRGQTRKSGDKPYILHPFSVSQILAAAGADDDLVLAGYLHDAAEDTGVTLDDIEDRCGLRVRRLVAGVTKASHAADGRKYSSDEKSAMTEEAMLNAHSDVAALKAADLIVNMSDLIIDQQDHGYEHWEKMFRDKAPAKLNHYARLGDILVERLRREDVYPRLASTLESRLTQFRALLERWPANA